MHPDTTASFVSMCRHDDAAMKRIPLLPLKFPGQRRTLPARRGQALVEFALVFPIFFTLLIAIIEFSFVLNGQMAINFATREAALIGAEAGNAAGADCVILKSIEDSIGAPSDDNRITQVRIYRSDTVGNPVPTGSPMINVYTRGGPMSCPLPGNSGATVGFTRVGAAGYPEISRCNTIAGCGAGRPLDHIGVEVTYAYSWKTPLPGLVGLGGIRLHARQVERDAHGADPVMRPIQQHDGARSDRRRERGQSVIELAISVPVVMLLLLGMLEFGFIFTHHLGLEYASREGARMGAALGSGTDQVGLRGR